MSEEKNNTQQAEGNSESNPSTQAEMKQDVPYSRFQEKNAQWKERGEIIQQKDNRIAELEAKQEEQRQKALKDAGNIETLLQESQIQNAKYKETIEKQGTEISSYREGLVNQVPEERRYITDNMSMANLQKFVQDEQMVANAGKVDSSRAGTTAKGEFGGYSSPAEFAAKDPKGYQASRGIVGSGIKIAYGNNE